MTRPFDSISPTTQQAIARLLFNDPLDVPATADYGVDSERHYRALREAISYYEEYGDTQEKVDAMLKERWQAFEKVRGNGKAITAFVDKYAPTFQGLAFRTSWDVINEGI